MLKEIHSATHPGAKLDAEPETQSNGGQDKKPGSEPGEK
jgi:hypothetical protein